VVSFDAIASRNFTLIDFKISGFDIDRDNLAMITFLDLRSSGALRLLTWEN
jgi:hypothetical protein